MEALTKPRGRIVKAAIGLFLAIVLARFAIAALTPIVLDEAYYIEWSKALDGGYFDHPPLIAWVNATSRLWPASVFMGRLGAMLAAALAFPFLVGLFRRAGLTEPRGLLVALVFANLNAYVLAAGLLTTPDAVQITLWSAALYEGAVALSQDRRRWVTAGLAAGIGLLGKYTMALIGPVFVWGIVRGDPKALRTPWPYAGVLAALLAFSPHLVWNARHEWVPIRMQLQHGFQGGHDPGFALSTDLPAPQSPAPDGPEIRLSRCFQVAVTPIQVSAQKATPKPKSIHAERIRRVAEYVGGLVIVWGAFLGLLVHWLVLRLIRRMPPAPALKSPVRPLLTAAVWVPILLFGVVSLVAQVEANWAAVYVIAAAALLARYPWMRLRDVVIHGGVNIAGCLVLALYAHHPLPVPLGTNRVLKETAGWRQLAAYVGGLEGPILVFRAQPAAMIRFYQPDLTVAQWPGLSQPSEFVRRPQWNYYTHRSLRDRGSFWLIAGGPLPPRLEGFEPVEMTELRYTLDRGLIIRKAPTADPYDPPDRKTTIHLWYAIHYRAIRPPEPQNL